MNKTICIIVLLVAITACHQNNTVLSNDYVNRLEEFKKREKFIEEDKLFYPGIGDPELKPVLTKKINEAADDFLKVASMKSHTPRDFQKVIKLGMLRFEPEYLQLDTEDRERICKYFEELMKIVGLESSDGLLNNFMYGFDPKHTH